MQTMQFVKLNAYIEQMDALIRQEHTGTAEEFARKLGVSERTLQNHLQQLREIGIHVIYDYNRRTYKYSEKGRLSLNFTPIEISEFRGGSEFITYYDLCDPSYN